MTFFTWIRKLEKRKIISRKPHPIIPFILASISLILGIIVQDKTFKFWFLGLAVVTFVFAIAHWIVVIVTKKKK